MKLYEGSDLPPGLILASRKGATVADLMKESGLEMEVVWLEGGKSFSEYRDADYVGNFNRADEICVRKPNHFRNIIGVDPEQWLRASMWTYAAVVVGPQVTKYIPTTTPILLFKKRQTTEVSPNGGTTEEPQEGDTGEGAKQTSQRVGARLAAALGDLSKRKD
jgi:hypothetical protein